MPSFRPTENKPPRLTGIANLFRALRNLGMFGGPVGHDSLEHFAADDGQEIPVAVIGDGPPVVLVHGLGCWHRHWIPVAKRLARSHSVYVWDARGHGQSRPLPGIPITLRRLADDLCQLLDHFGLDRAVLVGHSMGALTVMQYLHDHGTARVAGVGIVDQSPRIVTDDEWRLGLFGGCSAAMLEGLITGARKDLAEIVLHEIEAKAGWLRGRLAADATLGAMLRRWLHRIDATPLLDLAESLAAADFRRSMPRLDAPLMVVLGKRSPHYADVPLEEWYRQAVPHATVIVYERGGHSPHYTEPARFARELMQFISEHA